MSIYEKMIDFNLKLQSENILLRPILSDDFNAMRVLTSDEKMWIYFTSDLSIISELKKWVTAAVSQLQNKTRLAFSIIDLKTSAIIGSTSFANIAENDKRIEIGWTWISKDYQGKGYNNEMKRLMLKYCFEKVTLERVEFKTDVLNIPARKALKKIGAVEEGILRSRTLMTHNRRRDTIFYSVLKNEWPEIKKNNNWD